jgi:ubiquinone/menaquinone biosynthesis C-methylase UbiE
MDNKNFYEKYWSREGGSPAERDFAVEERKALLKNALLLMPKGQHVIDLGCGKGDFTNYIHELGFSAVGLDISAGALRKARSSQANGTYIAASLEDGLPFTDGSFGAVFCSEVLEHIFSVHAALSELNRILSSDGLLILTVPYHGLAKNLAIALFGYERHYDPNLSHIRFFTRKSLAESLNRSGFKVVATRGIGRLFPFWMCLGVVARKVAPSGPEPEILG